MFQPFRLGGWWGMARLNGRCPFLNVAAFQAEKSENHQEGNKVGGVGGDGFRFRVWFENMVSRFSWKISRKSKPYLTSSTSVEWGVPYISTTLFPYSSTELLIILMVILKGMKITGQPPPFPHAEGVAQQRKSNAPAPVHAEGVAQVKLVFQPFRLGDWWGMARLNGRCPFLNVAAFQAQKGE